MQMQGPWHHRTFVVGVVTSAWYLRATSTEPSLLASTYQDALSWHGEIVHIIMPQRVSTKELKDVTVDNWGASPSTSKRRYTRSLPDWIVGSQTDEEGPPRIKFLLSTLAPIADWSPDDWHVLHCIYWHRRLQWLQRQMYLVQDQSLTALSSRNGDPGHHLLHQHHHAWSLPRNKEPLTRRMSGLHVRKQLQHGVLTREGC